MLIPTTRQPPHAPGTNGVSSFYISLSLPAQRQSSAYTTQCRRTRITKCLRYATYRSLEKTLRKRLRSFGDLPGEDAAKIIGPLSPLPTVVCTNTSPSLGERDAGLTADKDKDRARANAVVNQGVHISNTSILENVSSRKSTRLHETCQLYATTCFARTEYPRLVFE